MPSIGHTGSSASTGFGQGSGGGSAPETYAVRPGDNMTLIAAQHRVSLEALIEANRNVVHNPDLIYPGQLLVIPSAGKPKAAHGGGDLFQQLKDYNKIVSASAGSAARQTVSAARRQAAALPKRSGAATAPAANARWMETLLEERRLWQSPQGWGRLGAYRRETGLGGGDWCSIFANWVMRKNGIRGTNSAGAVSWLNWGRVLAKPVPGCITVLRDGCFNVAGWQGIDAFHVTFFMQDMGYGLKCLGGNQHSMVDYSTYEWVRAPRQGCLFHAAYRWPV